jgi:hypothetical protein
MQFGAGTTVTLKPRFPKGPDRVGVVNAEGELVIGQETYAYDGGPPKAYRYQEPGDPPGDWYTIEFSNDGTYRRYLYTKEFGARIHVETGTWTAVA